MDEMRLLKQLCEAFGPSTLEDDVARLIESELEDGFEFLHTPHKHLIVVPHQERYTRTIMFQAHMDELGFRPYRYSPEGFIELSAMGGVPEDATNSLLRFQPTGVRGILLVKREGTKLRYFLDAGAMSAKEALEMIPYHSNGAYVGNALEESPGQLAGKSFDDRAGCAAIVKVLKDWPRDEENRIVGVFTSREETGDWPVSELRGAIGNNGLYPDLIINVEVCPGGPTPLQQETIGMVGAGLVLVHMDSSYAPDSRICKFMADVAADKGVAHQHIAMRLGSGELGRLALGFGVHGYPLSIPGRYMHCPHSVISKQDYLACIHMCREIALNYRGVD
ncbi:M20/M25/M40 family metallo-hydrolase [bacterium]|nr:M20/M25/M40 family metallo-hydrolase [candidate division CSSED10-310 bacterium]